MYPSILLFIHFKLNSLAPRQNRFREKQQVERREERKIRAGKLV